jgi:hypothetical protein
VLTAVEVSLGGTRSWDHPSYAGRVADYVLLGGWPFWTRKELALMLAGLREDFGAALRSQDPTMIADRLARFRVLAETGETAAEQA